MYNVHIHNVLCTGHLVLHKKLKYDTSHKVTGTNRSHNLSFDLITNHHMAIP